MDGLATDCAAFGETIVFLRDFDRLKDPRQPGKVTYPLVEILLLCLLAVTAGADGFTAEPSTATTHGISAPPQTRRAALATSNP
jgi:hypothetical protein